MHALANSAQLGRQIPKQNILQDLFRDEQLDRQSGGVEYEHRNRLLSPMMLPVRQSSLDKNKLLLLSKDVMQMKRKLNKADHTNNQKKQQKSEVQQTQRNAVSRINSVSFNSSHDVQKLQQKIEMLTLQLKQQKTAHLQKQDFYRQLLANQEQEMAALELSVESQNPLGQLAKSLIKTDEMGRILREEFEDKIILILERINRLSFAAKRCKNLVSVYKKRHRSRSRNSQIEQLKERQIESIISEYQKIQRKLQDERMQLQTELEDKKSELEKERCRFEKEIQQLKQKYTNLLNSNEQRHAKSLERCYQQMTPQADPKESKKLKEIESKMRYLEAQNSQKQLSIQKLEVENDGLKECILELEKDRSSIQMQLDRLHMQKEANDIDLEVLASNRQSEYASKQLQNIKNINEQLKTENYRLQKDNFQLNLRLKKQQELQRRTDRAFTKLVEAQKADYDHDDKEIASVKSQLAQLRKHNQSWQSDMLSVINNIKCKDPFLSLLRAQYTADTHMAAIEVLKTLNNIVQAKEKEEEIIKEAAGAAIKLKDFYTLQDVVQQLMKSIDEEREKNKRDKSAWLAMEQKLTQRHVKLQQKMKKVDKPKQDNTAVELKYEIMRKDNEIKQLNNKIEVQQFEITNRNVSFEQQLKRREKLLADKDMMIEDLKKRMTLTDNIQKIEVIEKVVTNNEPLERQVRELKQKEIELQSSIQRLKEQNAQTQHKYERQMQDVAAKSAKIQILTQFQKEQTEKSYDLVKERQKAASQNQALLNRATTAEQKVQSLQLRIKQLEKSNMELMEMRHRQHLEREKMQKIKKSTEQVVEKRLHSKLDEVARLKEQLKASADHDHKTRQELLLYKSMLEQAQREKEAEKQQVQQLREEMVSQREGLEAINEQYRLKFTDKVARKKEKNTELSNSLNRAQQEIHRLHQENHKLTQQLKVPMQEHETLLQYQDHCRQLQQQRISRESEYLRLLNEATHSKQKLLEQEDVIEENANKMHFLISEIDNLNNKLTNLQNEPPEELLTENQQQKAEIELLNSRIELLNKQVDGLQQELEESQQQHIFGISQQPYQAEKPSADILDLFSNIKTAIENIIQGQEISVEFYSQLPLELERPFQELMQNIKDKMVNDVSIEWYEERDNDELLEEWFRYLDEAQQHESIEQLRRQLMASLDQNEELRHASEQHQKTVRKIQVMATEHLDKQEENEQRHIMQLTVMKQELKKLKQKVDSDEMQLETVKKCFLKILDTVFDEYLCRHFRKNNLEEDLAEEFQHLCTTVKLSEKQLSDLQNYFKKYVIQSQKQLKFLEALNS